ncbi:hypothetical protein AB0I28_34955 [Phytomonospora sp. NPDC050363]|uniref:hypothetical protein n=1 Tax=Phytomonospora sp. NPDC050363 TaxID=3155642 RepID=UPI0033DE7DE9
MSDPYRITDAPAPPNRDRAESRPGRTALRSLLWIVMIAAVGGNVTSNLLGRDLIGILCGSVGVVCIVALVVSHVKGRRR